jgi:hypothetical protein
VPIATATGGAEASAAAYPEGRRASIPQPPRGLDERLSYDGIALRIEMDRIAPQRLGNHGLTSGASRQRPKHVDETVAVELGERLVLGRNPGLAMVNGAARTAWPSS